MAFKVYTLAERPELGENDRVMQLLTAGWPAFVLGDPVALETWPRVTSEFADHHVALVEEPSGRLVGIGFGISFAWDGTPAGLPGGWHGVVAQALADRDAGRTPTAAAALSITIAPTHQGRGLSEQVLLAMRGAAARQGFAVLVAPVRPSLKHRYPLTPMERYVTWTRADGAPLDPWLRVHWRLGAVLVAVCSASTVISASVAAWEAWTGLAFPDSGEYVVDGGLVPVTIDRVRDLGRYTEPNVWMRHTLSVAAHGPQGGPSENDPMCG
jgi:GNAT superfamily N-acetyltransferase